METTPKLRTLFVGGPGRSGTTVVAQRLCELPQTVAFEGVELKFFTEKNGLLDLWHSLGEHYSPNRAVVAMRQFRQFTRQLIDGQFSQLGLSSLAGADEWHSMFDKFAVTLLRHGHPEPIEAAKFDTAVQGLVAELHQLATAQPGAPAHPTYFVDNTPHTISGAAFVTRILPNAAFFACHARSALDRPIAAVNALGSRQSGPMLYLGRQLLPGLGELPDGAYRCERRRSRHTHRRPCCRSDWRWCNDRRLAGSAGCREIFCVHRPDRIERMGGPRRPTRPIPAEPASGRLGRLLRLRNRYDWYQTKWTFRPSAF